MTETPPPLYHGTRRPFTRGGYVFPAAFHGGEIRPGHAGDDSTEFAYVTTDHDLAAFYALNAKGRGRPRVLTVTPTGPIEDDPSTYDGEREAQYRSRSPFRVVDVEVLDPADWSAVS